MAMYYKRRTADKVFDAFVYVSLALFAATIIVPFLFITSMSLSKPANLTRAGIFFLPRGFTLAAYRDVLTSRYVQIGYLNTVLRTAVGTTGGVLLCASVAFPLAHRNLPHRGLITTFFVFTMFFSGGLIPSFLLMKSLRLLDTRASLILPMLYNTWYIIIIRNFFISLPAEIEESAEIDGANHIVVLTRVIMPMSTAVLATVALWLAVQHWNAWFDSLIYIRTITKHVVQVALRKLTLEMDDMIMRELLEDQVMGGAISNEQTLRAAMIMVTMLPMLMVYPFIQKYFVKGVIVGSLKG